MRIVIAGAGEVGCHLAKLLSNEAQDIIVVDKASENIRQLEDMNLYTYLGSPLSINVLRKIEVGKCDLFIAVTPYETRNITACAIAKSLGAKKTIARVESDEFYEESNRYVFQKMGVDALIYPEYLAAFEILKALQHPWARHWFDLFDGQLIVAGVKIRKGAKIVGVKLRDFANVTKQMHISAIRRNNEVIIPSGNDMVLEDDVIYLSTTKEHVAEVRQLCGKQEHKLHNLIILGGGNISENLARIIDTLELDYHINILESSDERIEELVEHLPNCRIDKIDTNTIEQVISSQEYYGNYDAFISLLDSAESNILNCIAAKGAGAKKTVAEVENLEFVKIAERLNIGSVINKKLLASSKIFQILLDDDKDTTKCLALTGAEVAEIVIKEDTKVTDVEVRHLKLPREMTIAGLVRNGVGQLVSGTTKLQVGDHVVIFCLSGALYKMEKVFNK